NQRETPARAPPVVEAEDFRAKSDRERLHRHAAPAGDEEVPEFMKENDDGQHEEEGDDVRPHPRCQVHSLPTLLVPPRLNQTPGNPAAFRIERQSLFHGSRLPPGRRTRRFGHRVFANPGYFKKADLSGKKGSHRYLVGGAENVGRPPAEIKHLARDPERGKALRVWRLECQAADGGKVEPGNGRSASCRPGKAV